MIYFPLYFQLLYQDFDGLCTCMISHFNHVQFFARILCPWDYPGKNSGMSWQTLLILWLQFSSVAQSCPTLCDPMNHSTPGLPVHHQLPEFTQTHVHRVSVAIQPSHPLSSPSPPAPNPSQYQSLFQWVNLSHEWPKYWSFSFSIIPSKEIPGLIFRMDWLDVIAESTQSLHILGAQFH